MNNAAGKRFCFVREVPHFWITLSDGTRLSARMWLPENAHLQPVPSILEYLPYRKRDGTAFVDEQTHPLLASHGYACLRVDIRGTGESDGHLLDEYLVQEQDDALEVIEWIRTQEWCTGRVGMLGMSWGGFSALQVAARQPIGLSAIVTVCSTVDRYAEDVHFKGGNLLLENVAYGGMMMSYLAMPADPLLVGDGWQEQWLDRLNNVPLMLENWLGHQNRDDYWKHGSVSEDYQSIKAAVYCVGGWGDGYRNSIAKMLANLGCPTKALIGPWIHAYPHLGTPAPAIDFVLEMVRWWDYWLKDLDNGIMDEPKATFYIPDVLAPAPAYSSRPGFWTRASTFPPAENTCMTFSLTQAGVMTLGEQELASEIRVQTPVTTGTQLGKFCVVFGGPEGHADQRRDDAVSMCFDTPVLAEALTLAGAVMLELRIAASQQSAQLVAKLSAVAPDGAATLLTYGATRVRPSLEKSDRESLDTEQGTDILLAMDDVGVTIPMGYKLRLALSTGSFPLLWPNSTCSAVTLRPGRQHLHLPVFIGGAITCPFEDAPAFSEVDMEGVRAPSLTRTISEDMGAGRVTVEIRNDLGQTVFTDHGLCTDQLVQESYAALHDDPQSVEARLSSTNRLSRGDWKIEVNTSLSLSSDAENFMIDASQVAKLGDEEVHRRNWHRRVPRTSA
ncbi:CocE/NonD family hydrolase [Paraburkholderia dipogonis]|uniref:CocE/NonD family hydrolase n=1 Tax=Paraburkholderia dipogonis TaxID=1211383 RepID=A0A4Y8MJG0_9BURK|nr:CocE/NonD family hydrolase [Paraburkholderia dipogonis]TFE37524.1 CocE/NonD family hydrolase [Paraburkholderia dipogonis]